MAGKIIAQVKVLKVGKYVIIDDVPCKVISVDHSKPGKHGAAKARVMAIGIFNGQKKQLLKPVDSNCEIPMVDKRKGQVVADLGEKFQLMDLETYETFEIEKPDFDVETGEEVTYMEVLGEKRITQGK